MPLLYHVISFSYNAALLAEEDANLQNRTFFLTEICDLKWPANQNNRRLHMT